MRRPSRPAKGAQERVKPAIQASAAQDSLPGSLPAECLEHVASHGSFSDRLRMAQVNRHWCQALRSSMSLWASLDIEFGGDSKRASQILAFLASRSKGIKKLAISIADIADWPEAAFALATVRDGLRRCSVVGVESDCELPVGSGAFLCSLRGLTSLELDGCCFSLDGTVAQLTALQELVLRRDHWGAPHCGAPPALGRLRQLTRLELVRCTDSLPRQLSALSELRVLNLHGSDLSGCGASLAAVLGRLAQLTELDLGCCSLPGVPASLSALTALSSLCLGNAFQSGAWGGADVDARLACLAALQRLTHLDLSDSELRAVPAPLAGLASLQSLKLGMNPLRELTAGPYLAALTELDLRASRLATLPQHLTDAQRLQGLGLSCCHELVLDSALAESVIGKLMHLRTLTLCGQQMNTVDAARCMHQLGTMLPHLHIVEPEDEDGTGEENESDEDEYGEEDYLDSDDPDAWTEGDSNSEYETDAETGLSDG